MVPPLLQCLVRLSIVTYPNHSLSCFPSQKRIQKPPKKPTGNTVAVGTSHLTRRDKTFYSLRELREQSFLSSEKEKPEYILLIYYTWCVDISLMYILLLFFDGYVLQLKWSPPLAQMTTRILSSGCI